MKRRTLSWYMTKSITSFPRCFKYFIQEYPSAFFSCTSAPCSIRLSISWICFLRSRSPTFSKHAAISALVPSFPFTLTFAFPSIRMRQSLKLPSDTAFSKSMDVMLYVDSEVKLVCRCRSVDMDLAASSFPFIALLENGRYSIKCQFWMTHEHTW